MAGSNGNVVSLLERIADRLDGIDGRLDGIDGRLDGIDGRLDVMQVDMIRGFAQVNARIDNLIDITGRYHADHEQRIQHLEAITSPQK